MSLFRGPNIQQFLDAKLKASAAKVATMSASEVNNPALAGAIEKLWTSSRPTIPVVFPDRRSGTRREEQRTVEDYGRTVVVNTTVVDVQVPYKGDRDMFNVSPSSKTLLNETVTVGRDHLSYTMPLDPTQEPMYNALLAAIEGNLAAMRTEEQKFSEHAIKLLYQSALDRRKQLEDAAKKASGFSFPVS